MEDIFKGKTVLITGGTGFLGKSITKRLLELEPHAIRLFSNSEVEHFQAQKLFQDDRIRHFFGDVRDFERLKQACKGADIVIHAAAMKRIDLIEYNVMDAIKTNVVGTMNTVQACLENKVEKAVFVSTDKACSPINSYGATKMLGERIFIESNYSKGPSKTVLTSVRYGNVIESTGSVIPFFIEKIQKGQNIPLTDKRMSRFIITPDRAVDLVFTAVKNGIGGEVFVPKLKALKVVDLIDVLREQYGRGAGIEEIGIRPGEKIHEELVNADEATRCYEMNGDYVVLNQIDDTPVEKRYPFLKGKRPVDFASYCSRDFVVGKEEIKRILGEAGCLGKGATCEI